MSIQDERDLRTRLGGLMGGVEAAPAPIARAMRRGRVIRMRRWVSAAAGVAVLAAVAVVVPQLIQDNGATPMVSGRYTVTVQELGPTAKGGVIATGTIDSKHWRIVLSRAFGDGCAPQPYVLMCGFTRPGPVGPRDVNFEAAAANGTQFQFGTVGQDVTRVVIRLSNGASLDLRPISAGGNRWVGIAAPLHAVVGAESFVGSAEYQYAVPYPGNGFATFSTWLRPGEPGLPRATRQLGSGTIDGEAWNAFVHAGPWGYCITFTGGSTCFDTAAGLAPPRISKPLLQLVCTPMLDNRGNEIGATFGVLVVPAGVKNLVLRFADGSHLRLVAVPAGGIRAIAYAIPKRPKILHALEYGFAGQLVGSTSVKWPC